MRVFLALLLAASLTGCGTFNLIPASETETATARGVETISLFDGALSLRGPDGYCVDLEASQPETGFVLTAACARVSDAELQPTLDAVLTYQIDAPGTAMVTGAEQDLADFLATASGQSLLAQSGTSENIEIHDTFVTSDRVLIHYTESEAPMMDGIESPEWRAFFDLNDRLVTLSLRAFSDTSLTDTQSRALLTAAIDALDDANSADLANES